MTEGKIICAVDFGTTFSGVAYAFREQDADPKEVDIELIEDHWPGLGHRSSPKVPTIFKFDNTSPNGFKWGFQLDDDPEGIYFTKLYLDPSQIQAAQALAAFSTKPGRLPPNRKVTDGISRYLAALRDVALDRMGADWTTDFVESTPIEYILTVPAVWSDKAKSDTLLCASQAGFGPVDKIRLITEPEAAAVYTFTTLPDYALKKGEIFITCDAGGGTVDLTTYKVTANDPVLRLGEVTVGSGGLCGSVYLNKRFEELVRKRIGKQLNLLSKTSSLNVMNDIQRTFNDDIKPDFGSSEEPDKLYYVSVPSSIPDDAESGVERGSLVVKSSELKEVFDKVMHAIFQLIVEQMERVDEMPGDATVSTILLVGGFGGSEYLRKSIQEHFGEDIKVIQPPDAWSAVTRGAILRGLQGDIIESRIIRANYAVKIREPWNSEIHESTTLRRKAEKLKFWDSTEQFYKCSSIMRWYVKKGDEFTNQKVVKFPFYRVLTDLSNLKFTEVLYAYTGNGEAPYFHDETCKTVATLTADLSQVSPSEFEVVSSSNGDYYKIWYAVEMSFEAAISFRLLFNDRVVGEVTADYGRR